MKFRINKFLKINLETFLVYKFSIYKFAPVIMEDKKQFLKKAAQLFLENGAKTLTMDDVAREFGMSKKTLYQMYKNKEALLEEVLKIKMEEAIEKFRKMDMEIDNAIERMFCRDEELEKVSEQKNSLLLKQLIKYYPAIFHRHMMDFAEKFSEVMVHNIEKGRKQGYYREDFDAEIYSRIFFQMAMSYDSSPYFDTTKVDRQIYLEQTFLFYMNAITTEKGKEYLKKLNK